MLVVVRKLNKQLSQAEISLLRIPLVLWLMIHLKKTICCPKKTEEQLINSPTKQSYKAGFALLFFIDDWCVFLQQFKPQWTTNKQSSAIKSGKETNSFSVAFYRLHQYSLKDCYKQILLPSRTIQLISFPSVVYFKMKIVLALSLELLSSSLIWVVGKFIEDVLNSVADCCW